MESEGTRIIREAEKKIVDLYSAIEMLDPVEASAFLRDLQRLIDRLDEDPFIGTPEPRLNAGGTYRTYVFGGSYTLVYEVPTSFAIVRDVVIGRL